MSEHTFCIRSELETIPGKLSDFHSDSRAHTLNLFSWWGKKKTKKFIETNFGKQISVNSPLTLVCIFGCESGSQPASK